MLDKLAQELRDGVLFDIPSGLQQIREDLSLEFPTCADGVGLILEQKCLGGTRTKILNEIIDWIDTTDATAPRVFWLSGQAGTGKSAIAHAIALYARNLGTLGSCFCFARVRQHEGLHTMLFATIARDLTDRDLRLRPLLAKVIKDPSLANTADVLTQWHKLVVEPMSQLQKGSSTGNVVVVIDALDESGAEATRMSILEALTENDGKLPMNLRIFLTSRPLVDIKEVLHFTQHVHARSLDDIDTQSTRNDIQLYVSSRLKALGSSFSDEDLRSLAAQSGGVFEWARLACDFISHPEAVIAKKRLETLTHAPGDTLLDEMYMTFLKALTEGPSDVLPMFRSVMRQILWLKVPLSISALDFMRCSLPRVHDQYSVGIMLSLMASLLSGTSEASTPVCPLHSSFYDFLLDDKRSQEFFIEQGNVHHDLAVASLSVMQKCLQFNICGLETSYVPNVEVVDLHERLEKNISPSLLYACQFWATHLQDAEFDVVLAELVSQFVTGEQ